MLISPLEVKASGRAFEEYFLTSEQLDDEIEHSPKGGYLDFSASEPGEEYEPGSECVICN